MSFTFISRSGSGSETSSGTIVLWYGTKATIPNGWEYYSAAVGKLIAGALTPDTTPLGNATHDHSYSANTGQAGSHGHTVSVSIGAPINTTTPGHYGGGATNAYWATKEHINHNQSVTVSTAAAHGHTLQKTGTAANLPPSFGLYYIRKV
jgi:hypothetical protein